MSYGKTRKAGKQSCTNEMMWMRGVVVTYVCVRDIDENSFRFSCKSQNCLRKLSEKVYLEVERNDGSKLEDCSDDGVEVVE